MMLDKDLLKRMDKAITDQGFKSRTEFVRVAIKEKIDFEVRKRALAELRELREKTTGQWKSAKDAAGVVEVVRREEDQAV